MDLNRDDRRVMRALFGHRVRFDEAERRLYRTDLWRPPAGVRALVRSTPEAIVLPEDESDLVELVRYADEVGTCLVPRGGGTAFDGGSMPVKGGIVVDFANMDKRFEPLSGGEEFRVGAGTTFSSVAARLAVLGRAPLLEPVFPEATTVGGWLATGGVGFGSNQYGSVDRMVRSARVVLPDGSRREFSGSELDVIAGACGATGLISTVTIRTRALQDETPFLASFDDLNSLAAAFEQVRRGAGWWTLMIETPETAALKAEALGTRAPARNAFLLLGVVAQESFPDATRDAVERAVKQAGGKVVDAKKTALWWATHAEVYRSKALGPSMVSGSAVVPTNALCRILARVHDAVEAPHWLMTGVVAGDESLLIGYALDDERRPPHEAAFGAVLAMAKAVGPLGGRPASLGVQGSGQAHRVMGPERLERVRRFKNAVDRKGIMNPGKLFGTEIARFKPGWAPGPSVQLALSPGAPLLRALHGSSFVRYQRREEARAPYKAGLSAALGAGGAGAFGAKWAWDVVAADVDAGLRHASASARAFGSLASSPLGWLSWIKGYLYERGTLSAYQWQMLAGEGIAAEAEMKSRFGLRYSRMLIDLKAQLIDEGFRPLPVHRRIEADCLEHHNAYGRSNDERARWAEGLDLPEKGATLVFVDDAVSFEAPGFARQAVSLLKEADQEVAYLGENERSSGHVLLATGQHEAARGLVEHNVKAIKDAGAKTVITLDPWTHHVFKRLYPAMAKESGLEWDVQVLHVYEVLAKHQKAGKLSAGDDPVRMALHHPPVFGLDGIGEEVAHAALSLFGIEAVSLPNHGKRAMDVGASGAVSEAFPEIATFACRRVLEDAARIGVGHVVSSDPGSGLLLSRARDGWSADAVAGVPAVHALGDEVPSPPVEDERSDGDDGDSQGQEASAAKGAGDEEEAPRQSA